MCVMFYKVVQYLAFDTSSCVCGVTAWLTNLFHDNIYYLPFSACTHAHSAWLNSVLNPHGISIPPETNVVFDDPGDKGHSPVNITPSIIKSNIF